MYWLKLAEHERNANRLAPKVDWHFHDLRAKAATDTDHLVLGKQHSAGDVPAWRAYDTDSLRGVDEAVEA